MNVDRYQPRKVEVTEQSETRFSIATRTADIEGYNFQRKIVIEGFTRQELIEALQNAMIEDDTRVYQVTHTTDPVSFWVIAKSGCPLAEDYRLQAYTDEELQQIKDLLKSKGYKEE